MENGVLIVEDDALLSIIEKRMIEYLGYPVLDSVKTGQEAITAARTQNPDLIVMDIFLQGELNGIDTMKEIRKDSTVPVIYLSGSDDPEYHQKAKAVQPVGFLTKPISRNELRDTIERAILHKAS